MEVWDAAERQSGRGHMNQSILVVERYGADAAITYYLAHRSEVDAYLIRVDEQKERDYQESLKHPSPLRDRLKALNAQRIEQAMKATLMTRSV